MSHQRRSRMATKRRARAPVFAALGDETRLSLVAKLCGGRPHSISQLTEGSKLTRQAITKHLRVLESEELCTASVRVARADSNSIPSRWKELRNTSISFPRSGIRHCPG